jgi:hypothetical protein
MNKNRAVFLLLLMKGLGSKETYQLNLVYSPYQIWAQNTMKEMVNNSLKESIKDSWGQLGMSPEANFYYNILG